MQGLKGGGTWNAEDLLLGLGPLNKALLAGWWCAAAVPVLMQFTHRDDPAVVQGAANRCSAWWAWSA